MVGITLLFFLDVISTKDRKPTLKPPIKKRKSNKKRGMYLQDGKRNPGTTT